jgi:flagellar biosynthesis/type III secretory pathway chaperone
MELDKMLENLFQILNEEYKLYRYIYKISEDKTQIIVKGKVPELEEIMKTEKAFVLRIGKLEELREKLVLGIAKNLEINADKINVSIILKNVKENDTSIKIKNLQEKIVHIFEKLKNTNEVNAKLIKNSLDFVDFSINILSNIDDGSNNYGNSGNINQSKKRTYFDRRY